MLILSQKFFYSYNPPASEASRGVYGVIEFVFLSVTNFDPNYLGTGRTELAEFFGDLRQNECSQKKLFVRKVASRVGGGGPKHFDTIFEFG